MGQDPSGNTSLTIYYQMRQFFYSQLQDGKNAGKESHFPDLLGEENYEQGTVDKGQIYHSSTITFL